MKGTYWRDFLLGASGLVIILYVGKRLSTPQPLRLLSTPPTP